MGRTVFSEKLAAAGARSGEYRGAETALGFSDLKSEYTALRQGCGIYDLGWRSKFRVAGRDRVRWLNNMVTNNTRDLPAGRGAYCFVLNPQGHILGDLYAYNRGDYYLLDTDAAQSDKIYTLLKRFIIMDQVEFKVVSEEWTAIGVQGTASEEILGRIGIDVRQLEALQICDTTFQHVDLLLLRGDDPKMPRYELWMAPGNAAKIWDELTRAEGTPVGADALELYRIASGIPVYGQDIYERTLPQETEQQHALSFTKGCYIGQEIVERIRSRGNVHRGVAGFRIEGSLPKPGSKVQVNGKEVGEITSVGSVPSLANGNIGLALGYLRRDVVTAGDVVQIGGSVATVQNLPFENI